MKTVRNWDLALLGYLSGNTKKIPDFYIFLLLLLLYALVEVALS